MSPIHKRTSYDLIGEAVRGKEDYGIHYDWTYDLDGDRVIVQLGDLYVAADQLRELSRDALKIEAIMRKGIQRDA